MDRRLPSGRADEYVLPAGGRSQSPNARAISRPDGRAPVRSALPGREGVADGG